MPGVVSPPVRTWKRHALALAPLYLVLLFAYSNSFNGGFVFDGHILLLDPRIIAATRENLHLILTRDYWFAITGTALYRPLATLTYLFNYAILGSGPDPASWHWINFLLHAVNLALVYALGVVLLDEMLPALAMAAVWGLHPVLTESVTNIIGRTDLLAAFGVLAGWLCHVRAASASGWRRIAWLAGLLLAAMIGIFSKESAAVLPALMAAYDIAFRAGRPLRRLVPAYLAVIAPLAFFFYARSHALAGLQMRITFTDNPLTQAGFWTARLTAVRVIGKYLWLLVWPASLSSDYSYNQVPVFTGNFQSWADWQTLISFAACAALAAAALYTFRRRPIVFFLIALFFMTLAPTANIFTLIGTIMAERFLYLPAIAFAGCLVLAALEWSRRRGSNPRSALAVVSAIALCFAIRTYARNNDWQDDTTLWSSAVEAAPGSYKAHMALASALSTPGAGRLDEVIHQIEQATAILRPLPDHQKNPAAYIDAGAYYGQKGESLATRNPDGTLGLTPGSKYWYEKALDSLNRARAIQSVNIAEDRREDKALGRTGKDAKWHELYIALGAVYLRMERPRDALQAVQEGIHVWPVPEFFLEMSSADNALGDRHRAALDLIQALTIDPSDARMTAKLTDLYQKIDPGGCSVRNVSGTPSLNMDCPLVHADVCAASRNLVAIYREAGMKKPAEQARQSAIGDLGCPVSEFTP